MSFLLEYLDVNKTSIKSNYYDIELDFSHVIIIATINRDIRQESEFNALRSRCDFVDFKNPSKENLKQSIKDFLIDDYFTVSTAHAEKPETWDTLRITIADFIIEKYYVEDTRQRQSRARELVKFSENEWESLAQTRLWKSTSSQ